MSPPNKISPPPGVIYDDIEGVCRAADPLTDISETSTTETSAESVYANISRSRLLRDSFGDANRSSRWWNDNPLQYSPWVLLSVAGCSNSEEPVAPGDPVRSIDPLGGEVVMNSQPIRGNLNEYDLSGAGSNTAVAWSVFNSTTPAETGTFAFLRTGGSGGSQSTVSNDTGSLHKFTTTATLDNGDTFVAYTKTTGEEDPSSIVARRLSSSGSPQGSEITLLAPGVRTGLPAAQLVSTGNGFVAVYRDGAGQLQAAAFDANGAPQGAPQDLGAISDSSPYVVSRGEGDQWVLAQLSSSNQIQVRTFSGVQSAGVDRTISTDGFPSSPQLSVAMQEDGSMMLAWNVQGGGMFGTVLNNEGNAQGAPFRITASGLANTLALASDHHGNFVFAWEQAGAILARIYNGTSTYTTPAEFSVISSGNQNSNVLANVTDGGQLTLTWIRSHTESGDVLQDVVRRDYRINY